MLLAGVLLAPVVGVAQVNGRSPALNAEAVLLLNTEGRTVFAKNAQLEHAPASLVKLMTLYLAFDEIEAGRASLDDPVTKIGRAHV